MNARYPTPVRFAAAALIIAGGVVHWKLWDDGYKDIDNVGVMFIINVISSIGLAVALAVWRHWVPVVCSFGLTIGSLVAFGISRTDWDILGFNENGFDPSPEAALALIFEIGAAALLVLLIAWIPLPPPFQRDEPAV